jgi:hypothetical protein
MHYLILLLFAPVFTERAIQPKSPVIIVSPLSNFSEEWDDPKYQSCNTAAATNYMNDEEKKIIYILNLARAYPKLFCKTVVMRYPEYAKRAELVEINCFKSLVNTMNLMKPLKALQPDQRCFNSAYCHAYSSGQVPYDGHERTDSCLATQYYNGECCDYNNDNALDIVMSLLIDEGVETLGHRRICFTAYKTIGVSIQPHKTWDTNAVLDFHY